MITSEVLTEAARLIAEGECTFSCTAIDVVEGASYEEMCKASRIYTELIKPELYHSVWFNYDSYEAEGIKLSIEEFQDICLTWREHRVMALLFVAAILESEGD